ncbi:MAG TPA: signal peptidase I [Thermoanaerobaculia bacterium]|nr:signal peptidase I [Thermoanaerobaculia bacterium]
MAKERSVLREYLEALLIAAIFLRFANTFVIQTFYIPSGSMEETLLVGDHLFVNRFIYGPAATGAERSLLPLRTVRRGDIVVFRSPENPAIDIVKRCVGLPGDKIEMVAKQLYINGKAVQDSTYAVHKGPDLPLYDERERRRDNFGPYLVPPESYFCMGDNRDNSYDSRYWGSLPAHLLKGRPVFIYWSYGGETGGEGPDSIRQFGRTAMGFLTKTRWSRTLHLIR